ncbi:MAG: FAD:protein FMN transferase, partial [Burkholderiaceae bacterium]
MQRRTFLSAAIGAGVGVGMCGALAARLAESPASEPGAIARGDATPDGRRLYVGADLAFGTTISVRLLHHDQRTAELAIADAIDQAKRIDVLMSLYREDSQVAELNRRGVLHQPDPDLVTVLRRARELSQLTGGAFDVTVQPLWRTWSEAAARGALPTDEARRAAMALVDWRRLAFDDRHVALLAPGMAITLNGSAQGYASDLALAAVKARGVADALLDTGEFSAEGAKAAPRPWVVGVRDPRRAD